MSRKTIQFGHSVFKCRKSLGLTQEELANLVGVKASTICRIENGMRKKLGYQLVMNLKKTLDIFEPEDGFKF